MTASMTPELVPYQQGQPFRHLDARRTLPLPVEQIHPLVRIAHLQRGRLVIPERIIFDHEIVLILEGAGVWEAGGSGIPYGPRDLLFVRPFVPHRFLADGGGDGAHIAVHFDFAPGVPDWTVAADDDGTWRPYQVQLTHGLEVPQRMTLPPGGPLEAALSALLREWRSDAPLAPLAVRHHLLTLLLGLLRAGAAHTPASSPFTAQNEARVALVVAHVRRHLDRPHTASALADVAGISAGRLNTLFRERTGHSLMGHVQRLRVQAARGLLADIRLSIKEVAARTGFHDTYHFSKAFRRVDGLSPLHYRQALLAGHDFAPADGFGNKCAEQPLPDGPPRTIMATEHSDAGGYKDAD